MVIIVQAFIVYQIVHITCKVANKPTVQMKHAVINVKLGIICIQSQHVFNVKVVTYRFQIVANVMTKIYVLYVNPNFI